MVSFWEVVGDLRKVLIVSEDPLLQGKIADILRDEGYYVVVVRNRDLALNCLEREEINIVLAEEEVLAEEGFQFLRSVRERFGEVVVLAVGGSDNPFYVRSLLNKGIYDYLSRPLTPLRLLSTIKRAEEHLNLLAENEDLKKRIGTRFSFAGITGVSEKMQRIFDLVLQVAQVRRPVLIFGEQGTGKELIARAIHQYSFPEGRPFFKVLCPGLPSGFLKRAEWLKTEETHKKLPDEFQGTLFFEDVHLLPFPVQAEVVDFLEEYRFGGGSKDFRIIASSETSLEEEVATGRFRSDLYYFLSAVKIEIPPLRERKEDIPFLIERFLREIAQETGKEVIAIDKEALQVLMEYDWPGNVIELRNVLEGMVILSQNQVLTAKDVPAQIRKGTDFGKIVPVRVGMTLEEAEKILILETLRANRFNKSKTAQMLGIGLRTLYRKIEQYDLVENEFSKK